MKSFTDWYKDVSGGHEPPHGNRGLSCPNGATFLFSCPKPHAFGQNFNL